MKIRISDVEKLKTVARGGQELWVKRDDRVHEVYGGNKARKLEPILADARRKGARRLVTLGSAGSHHVLATALFGREAGFEVEAVLVSQARSSYAEDVLRTSLALGLQPLPEPRWGRGAQLYWRRQREPEAYGIPLGGSSVLGCRAYVDAAFEWVEQLRAGALPEPGTIVVATGSGGTVAGLAAGLALQGLQTRVVGVAISEPAWAARILIAGLVAATLKSYGKLHLAPNAMALVAVEKAYLGAAYGVPTDEGTQAMQVAAHVGLHLDPTYTAKAFAAALASSHARDSRPILYWHTLSAQPLAGQRQGTTREQTLPPKLDALFR